MSKRPAPARLVAPPPTGGYSQVAFRAAVLTRQVAESAPTLEAPPAAPDEPDVTPDMAIEAGDATRLRAYWTTGKGAAKIRWGTDGDFTRCVKALDGKVSDPKGYCAELHHSATGMWPGDKRNNSAVAEPAPQPERTAVREATTGGATTTGPSRLAVRLIRAGWSLNGNYYPAEVLRRDGPAAWPKGTLCYVDHATDEEDTARPSGSIRNLAAVLTTDARWDEQQQALTAEARLFAPWREPITDMADSIGMSIRAWVTGDHGEVDGRSGFVVQSIPEGRSVDFVTVPAAGGGIVSVLESVGNQVPTEEARNAGHWLEARIHGHFSQLADEMFGEGHLNRDERIALSAAVGDGLAAFAARIEADAPHLYKRDPFDQPPAPVPAMAEETAPDSEPTPEPADGDTTPGTAAGSSGPADTTDVTGGAPPTAPNPPTDEEPDMSGTTTGPAPVEAGTATEPTPTTTTATTEAARPDGTADALAAVTAQLAQMREAFTNLTARADQRDAENRALRNQHTATEHITAALRDPQWSDVASQIHPRVTARVPGNLPTTGDGTVDVAALGEAITAAIGDEAGYVRTLRAEALDAAGVGQPHGLGATVAESEQDTKFTDDLTGFFTGTLGMTSEAARIAAKGRN